MQTKKNLVKWNFKFHRNKKGGVEDIIMILVFLFTFAVVLFIASHVGMKLTQTLNSSSIGQYVGSDLYTKSSKVVNLMDIFIVIIFFALLLGLLLTSMLTDVHPAFAIVFVLMVGISIITAIPMANGWEKLFGSGALSETAARFPKTNNIMANLPLITGIVGALGIIILYSKTRVLDSSGGMG